MPDREKIIKEFEDFVKSFSKRDDTYYKSLFNCVLALLKEQEAVKPVNVRWEMGINGGNCPKCMNWAQRTYNYCPFCGKEVKWDA